MTGDETPLVDDLAEATSAAGLCLVVIGEGFVENHILPDSGSVVIGRAPEADVTINLSALSRRHAALHIGDQITIEDLGSANGTFVHDAKLAPEKPVRVVPGDTVELGTVTLILQHKRASARPRRIWTHGYFEARLEEECQRARRDGFEVSLLRIKILEGTPGGRNSTDGMYAALRAEDIVASYGPNDYEVLISGLGAGRELDAYVQKIHEQLRAHGLKVRLGVASCPGDGRAPEALMAKACGAVLDRAGPTAEPTVVIESGAMKQLHRLVERVAVGSINILLLGETGVGKEIFADRVHKLSPRVEKPFVRLNSAALTDTLAESELFGHVKGAFTGAQRDKLGLFEAANGGSIFLDEIGDLSPALQAKLLRTLEDKKIRRVGGVEEIPVDVRVIAATHRDLEADVESGRFRRDLFFRINGVSLVIPPLRERREEIEPLAQAFLAHSCFEQKLGDPPQISDAALQQLLTYSWPGNLRELRNVMERAALLCLGGVIGPEHLPGEKLACSFEGGAIANGPGPRPKPQVTGQASPEPPTPSLSLREELDAKERTLIVSALERAEGNQTKAAKLLGIPRRTLIDRINAHGLPRPRKGK